MVSTCGGGDKLVFCIVVIFVALAMRLDRRGVSLQRLVAPRVRPANRVLPSPATRRAASDSCASIFAARCPSSEAFMSIPSWLNPGAIVRGWAALSAQDGYSLVLLDTTFQLVRCDSRDVPTNFGPEKTRRCKIVFDLDLDGVCNARALESEPYAGCCRVEARSLRSSRRGDHIHRVDSQSFLLLASCSCHPMVHDACQHLTQARQKPNSGRKSQHREFGWYDIRVMGFYEGTREKPLILDKSRF